MVGNRLHPGNVHPLGIFAALLGGSMAFQCITLTAGMTRSAGETYLFDCGGHIQPITAGVLNPASMRLVSDLDSTLPRRVRDGCAIRAGRFDRDSQRLTLVVQSQSEESGGGLPTRMLVLATPSLAVVPVGAMRSEPQPVPASRSVARRVQSLRAPFDRSAVYVLGDSHTVLLQELVPGNSGARPPTLDETFRAEGIAFRPPQPEATGRYAIMDLTSGNRLGEMAAVTPGTAEHRVICFTSAGEVYLAATRSTLLILDTIHSVQFLIRDVALDLYWSACSGS